MSELVFALPAAAPPAPAKPSPASEVKGSDAKDSTPFKDVLEAAKSQRPAETKAEPKAEAKAKAAPSTEDQPQTEPASDSEQAALTALAAAVAPVLLNMTAVLQPVETASEQGTAQQAKTDGAPAQAPQASAFIGLPEQAAPQQVQPAAEAFGDVLESAQGDPQVQQTQPQMLMTALDGAAAETQQPSATPEKTQAQIAPSVESQVRPKEAASDAGDGAGAAREVQPVIPQAGHKTTAPVVTEPARLAEAQTTSVISQIRDGVEALAQSKNTSVRLQLYPESLGRIELRVTSGEGGVRVSLNADVPATGVLLEKHLNDLRQTLAETGLNVRGVFVALGQNPRQQQPSDPRRFAGTSGGASISPAAIAEDKSDAGPGRRLNLGSAGSQVDYWI